jgi:hypothetical protein
LEQGKTNEQEKGAADAIQTYEQIVAYKLNPDQDEVNEENIKAKEQAAYRLASIFQSLQLFDELVKLTKQILPAYMDLPKSKQAKILRSLFDMCIRFPGKNRNSALIDLSQHIIAWCEQESRSFLRMKIENKLADLLYSSGKF